MKRSIARCLENWRRRLSAHPALGYGLLWGFVPFVVTVMEWGHLQSVKKVTEFVFQSPGIFLFDWMVVGLVYSLLLILTRRGWIAALATGGACMALSAVEDYQ